MSVFTNYIHPIQPYTNYIHPVQPYLTFISFCSQWPGLTSLRIPPRLVGTLPNINTLHRALSWKQLKLALERTVVWVCWFGDFVGSFKFKRLTHCMCHQGF